MADTTSECALPEPPFADLGQCTSTELGAYEAELNNVLELSSDPVERMRVMRLLTDVTDQWDTRAKITPGKAGRTWPIH